MDFAEQLKSALDIVKVIGEYVRLRRVGTTGRYTGLCPFHQEKTPSFGVHQVRQFYKCFGCDAKGDVINFVMEIEGLTFWEAAKLLAERHGIPLPKRSDYSDGEAKLRAAVMEMHSIAAQVFQANLRVNAGGEARAYLERRGVSNEMVEAFGLGYADPSGQTLARRLSEAFPPEALEASGLVRRRPEGIGFYDAFRGRLMFPIHNESGKPIAFGGRAMRDDDQPKYLNSPETAIYRKTSVLFNLHRAKEQMRRLNRAVLVEGYMDVIGTYAAGVREVVASCGTALTPLQIRAMRRHADHVVLNFDPDAAGANAAERAVGLLLDEGVHVRVVTLDGGLDPDEYVKQNGAEAYRAKLESSSGYFHWLADRARAKYDMRSAAGRVDAFKALLPAVQKIPDKLERAAVADDLSSYLGLERSLVLDQLKRAVTDRRAAAASAAPVGASVQIPPIERLLLSALLASDRARREILPALRPEIEEGFASREIFEALRHAARPETPALTGGAEGSSSPGASGAAGGAHSRDHAALFAAVEARLAGPAQKLLHEVAAADEISDEESGFQQAQACLERLENSLRKKQLEQLRARVKSAEQEGRLTEALEWMVQLHRLENAGR
ncbi:MAG TPA: DNA primase [Bryobacteraceae bacterium]